MVVFGSTAAGEFVVDTVFVVAAAQPWTPANSAAMRVDDAFRTCTVESVASGSDREAELMLYTGATIDRPVNGMYSFVPARRADDPDPAFARPVVQLPELINPSSTRRPSGSRRPLPLAEVRRAWDSTREQVLEASCVLAVHLDTPPRREEGSWPRERAATC